MKRLLWKLLFTFVMVIMVAIMWYLLGYKITLMALLIANYVDLMFKE